MRENIVITEMSFEDFLKGFAEMCPETIINGLTQFILQEKNIDYGKLLTSIRSHVQSEEVCTLLSEQKKIVQALKEHLKTAVYQKEGYDFFIDNIQTPESKVLTKEIKKCNFRELSEVEKMFAHFQSFFGTAMVPAM